MDENIPMGEDEVAARSGKTPPTKIKIITKKAEVEEASSSPVAVVAAKSHYCKECDKSFNSGKALGGHMSSAHVQASKDYAYKKSNSKRKHSGSYSGSNNTTCLICYKVFTSEKSLFGHMRCHPDRYWRGMEPPRPPPQPKIEEPSYSSATESDEPPSDDDDDDTSGNNNIVGFNLTSWPTSKRGRGPVISTTRANDSGSENNKDSESFVAGHQLIKLLNGDSTRVQENGPANPNNLDLGLSSGGKGKEKMPENQESESSEEIYLGAIQVLVSGKQGNCNNNNNINVNGKFTCNECGRVFSTHQALGGHRSSHNKFKMSIFNTNESGNSSEVTKVKKKRRVMKKKAAGNDDDGDVGGAVAFAFDLNMAPAEEDEEVEMQGEDSSNVTASTSN